MGKAPLSVVLQQVIQLSDAFGGVMPGIRALGDAFVGLLSNRAMLAVRAMSLLVTAYSEGSKEGRAYQEALVSSGNAVGATVGQLNGMAASIDQVVGTQGKAAETLALFAGQAVAGVGSLEAYAAAAISWERATGQAVGATAKQFASLKEDPLNAVLRLNDGMNFLTDGVYAQIKALVDQGQSAEATKVAQDALASALQSRSTEMVGNLGVVERAWRSVKGVVEETWDTLKGIGRDIGPEGRLAAQQQAVDNLEALEARGGTAPETPQFKARIAAAREALLLMQNEVALNQLNASFEAERATRVSARADVEKDAVKYLSEQQKIQQQIAVETGKIRAAYTGLTDDESLQKMNAEIKDRETAIRESHSKKGSAENSASVGESEIAQIKKRTEAQREYLKLLQAYGPEADKLTEAEKLVIKFKGDLKESISGVTRSRREDVLAVAEAQVAVEKQVKGEKERISVLEKSKAAYAALIEDTTKSAQALNQNADEIALSNELYGKGRTAIEQYRLSLIQAKLAEVEDGSDSTYDPEYVKALYAKLDAQTRVVSETRVNEFKQINQHADELLASANAMATAYKDEAALSGLTSLERAKIVAMRQVELKYAKELERIDKMEPGKERDAARAKVEQAQQIEGEAAVSKAIQDDWRKTTDQINQSLTDALMRGFESGASFGKSLRDALKSLFNTLVLRPIISATMTPISGTLGSLVQNGGVGIQAASGASGLLNMGDNLSSLWSMLSNGLNAASMGAGCCLGSLAGLTPWALKAHLT